ncbi:MAG: VWA domain-containing protein [Anaerolineae bacterium]
MGKARRKRQSQRTLWAVVGVVAAIALCLTAVGILAAVRAVQQKITPGPVERQGVLAVASSPEKEPLFRDLVDRFNRAGYRTSDGERMRIEVSFLEMEALLEAAVQGKADAVSPDSSVWLADLDSRWQEVTGEDVPLVGRSFRYAVSPVVIAAWEDVARDLGWPGSVGWGDLLAKAQKDPNFTWSHPSATTASGLLATLAEFYAAAGKTRGLTPEDVRAQATLDAVAALERTVRYYGEGEEAVLRRALEEGPGFLDAFVVQEQMVIRYNRERKGGPRLVAIYPQEGTLWEDHPMVLLEHPGLTAAQRETFEQWRQFLLSAEAQRLVLQNGYRPADLSIPLESPVHPDYGADPAQPQTTLQIPGREVVAVVRDAWWYTKRHTNVYLVVDTSGSMQGEKLENAQAALRTFIGQIHSDQERVGMVLFASTVYNIVDLQELGQNRQALLQTVDRLTASGNTALLDGVHAAYVRLQRLNDRERINAIVAMTDGKENNSRIRLRDLVREIREGNQEGVPVVIFCIAYGDDADYDVLESLAEASGGQVREGTLETIRTLYKVLSTYF